MKLNAEWFRKFLLHLRLPTSKSYSEWAQEKATTSRAKVDNKPREFERALAGYAHTLSKEEIDK